MFANAPFMRHKCLPAMKTLKDDGMVIVDGTDRVPADGSTVPNNLD